MSQKCPACGNINMSLKGFGTEKIEEEIEIFFPQVKTARLDLDSTRAKNAYQRIITDFEEKNIQILVGTQMVTKGLDFDNVGLVGVLNADNMLYFPDFRAYERSLQLMLQVAGRAGRKAKQGKVIIQTYNPKHVVIDFIQKHNYKAFYNYEIEQRKTYNYPPFFRIVKITLKHIKAEILNRAADFLAAQLKLDFGNRVLGPEFPTISRVHGFYQKNILLKTEKNIAVKYSRDLLKKAIENFQCSEHKSVRITIDVDAY
jgi:primosomal protein N' (replication factor Y)